MINKSRKKVKQNRCYCEIAISEQELKKKLEQGAILLDVRSPQEYQEGHFENAILLPEYEIKEKATKILPDKKQYIIVYCSTGHRSRESTKTTSSNGL